MSGDDDEDDRRDRQMIELLNELRVALPGVQILFGFLLTVPFAQGFQKTTPFQRDLYYGVLIASVLSTVCLIAPSANHRLRFHRRDRAYIIEAANRFLIGGLVFLTLAILGAVVLITAYLFHGGAVWVFPVAVAIFLLVTWYVRPLLRGDKSSGP